MDDYIFKRPSEEYKLNLSPVSNYVEQTSYFISKELNIDLKEAKSLVMKELKKHNIKNPIVTYKFRQDNGDMVIRKDKLTDYIKEAIDNNEVIVPSFTTYMHPSKKKSIHADFLSINIAKRKEDKHNAFKFKQLGDTEKSLYYNTMQKVRKIFNNSLSGAYASKSTILYNPSAHYTLTSITRSVASIGNAVSESVVAGNKQFKDPEVVINYITAILTNINKDTVEYCIDRYKLYIPTPEEVMDTIIYSSKYYWRDDVVEKDILSYLNKLEPYELASICYTNDLWHLRKFNEGFVKDMLTNISKKVDSLTDDPTYLYKAPEGVATMVHVICSGEIKGMNVDYKELAGQPIMWLLASTSKHATEELIKYKLLFRTFFTTDVLPTSIAFIKDMMRDAIVLSDTDSTCGSYDKWVDWYYGNTKFSDEAVALSSAVMTINTQAIDHNLKIFARNMNIENSLVELLKMKNEFFWPVFVATNVSKHYFADTTIQEGNVFKEPELELKGVHLIASAVDQTIVKRIHNMIKEVNKKISNNEKISLREYIVKIADIERELLTKIKQGSTDIYKKDKIKEAGSYKQEKTLSPYINHMLWEEVFAEKYGSPGEPTYMVIKIPTTLNSKKSLNDFLETIDDITIKDKLKSFLTKYKKEAMGTFRPPVSIISTKGIPEEFINAIDYKRIVEDNLNAAYLFLESLGFYRGRFLLTEVGY